MTSPMRHTVKLTALLASLLALGWLTAQTPTPKTTTTGTATHFGIQDGTVPLDPRDYGRGQFSHFPTWPISTTLPNDTFTFARLRYRSGGQYGYGRRSSKWATDYPDADLNFCYRLQQLTALQVNPIPVVVDINPEQIRHYPFLYLIEPGDIDLSQEEVLILRDYLNNGGFIMVDDFWGHREWENFYYAFKQIFPEREPEELPLEHEIFHCVFKLPVKPQIPAVGVAMAGRSQGITHEWNKSGSETAQYKGVFDDKRRMMMIICFNTDLGDGWEEEGTDPWYFREFSEKYAYPLGINILFYALTH